MKKIDAATWVTVSDGGKYVIEKTVEGNSDVFRVFNSYDMDNHAFESAKYRHCVKYIESQQTIDSAFTDLILEVQGEANVKRFKVLQSGSRTKQTSDVKTPIQEFVS